MILTCPNCDTRFHVDPDTFGAGRRKVRCSRCRHIWQQDPLPEPAPEPPPPPPPPPPKQEEEFPIPPRRMVIEPEPEPMPPPPPMAPAPPPISDEPLSRVMNIELDGDDDSLDRPPLHPPFDGPEETPDEDPDAVLAQRRERLARAGVHRVAPPVRKKRSFAWIGWLLLFALIGGVIGGGYEKRNELIAFYPPLAKLYEILGIPVDASDWLGLELHNLKSSTILEDGQMKIAVSGDVVNVGKAERAMPGIRVAMRGAGNKELNAYTLTLQQPRIGAGEKLGFDVKLPAPKGEVTDLEVAFASQTGNAHGASQPAAAMAPAAGAAKTEAAPKDAMPAGGDSHAPASAAPAPSASAAPTPAAPAPATPAPATPAGLAHDEAAPKH